MRLLPMHVAASLAICTSPLIVRDTPLNQTTTAPWDPTQIQSSPTETTEIENHTERPQFKPRPSEIGVDGFETTWFGTTTSVKQNVVEGRLTSTSVDIASIIESILNTAQPPVVSSAIVHFERSEDGWGELTPSAAAPSDTKDPPYLVVTGLGRDPAITGGLPPNNTPQATQLPGVIPQVTNPPAIQLPQVTPPPTLTYSGVTLRPVAVTSVRVLTLDGKPTTVSSIVKFRYVVGTATLQDGTSTTINNVVVALSVNPAGLTILVAGEQTTTMPPPSRTLQEVQTSSVVHAITISSKVVEGTTKYFLAGQTLAPGQAATVNGIPISITVQSQTTILVVGNATTTFLSGPIASTSTGWGAPAAGSFGGNGVDRSNPTNATSVGAGSPRSKSWFLTNVIGLAALLRPFI